MGIIRGMIIGDGRPLPDVIVTIKGTQGQRGARQKTDAAGVFETRRLEPGDYFLSARVDGFASLTNDVAGLSDGQELRDLGRLVLRRFGSISGQVTDERGAGVRNARGVATSRADGTVLRSKLTADDGRYTIGEVAPGAYKVHIEPPDGFAAPDATPVDVAPASDAQVDARLTASAPLWAVSGKVIDADQEPVADVHVVLQDRTGLAYPPVTTDVTGAYRIANLPNQMYTVTASHRHYADSSLKIEVNGGDTTAADIQVRRAAITGHVLDAHRKPARNVRVRAYDMGNQPLGPPAVPRASDGVYVLTDVLDGRSERTLRVQVEDPVGGRHPDYVPAANVRVSAGQATERIDFAADVVDDFLGRLDDTRFSLDPVIDLAEARQAVSLFAITTLMLAGHTRRRVNGRDDTDVLGVLRLSSGMQDGSLQRVLTFDEPAKVWNALQGREGDLDSLPMLARQLRQMQAEIQVLHREARRQFNLGLSNGVVANVHFPAVFRRYVEIAADPLLALDLRAAERNPAADPTRLDQATDLLAELKATIIELVRSLSRSATIATSRLNEDWARFQRAAMEAIAIVAQARVSSNLDDRNQWAVLADLTGRHRERDIAPYVALARHGTKLLTYALDIYNEEPDTADNYDRDHLLDRFQAQGTPEFWTYRLRNQATMVRRYPLRDWT